MNLLYRRIYGFIKYQPLLRELVIRDIKVRYRHSVLGILWTVLNPLMMMVILTIVFSSLLKMSINNFPVYVLTGFVVFNFHSEATSQGLTSVLINASLIKKVYIPKYLFPLSKSISALINFGFSFIALIIVMLITGSRFYITIITIWIPLLYLMSFSVGLAFLLSAIEVYFRDVAHLYSVVLMAWNYLTPLFYPISIVPPQFQVLIKANPMYHYVTFFRSILMDGVFPSWSENFYCAIYGIGMLTIGILVFTRLQRNFILHL